MSKISPFSPALALLTPVVGVALTETVDADVFLKFEGIEGESTDTEHEDWIELDSFSWGIDCPDDGSGTAQLQVKDLVVTKELYKSSPKLMLHACTGTELGDVTLAITDPTRTPTEYYKITFTKVLVTSYQTGGSSGDPVPVDSVSLNFTKITFEYHPQDGSGPVTETRDFSPPTGP